MNILVIKNLAKDQKEMFEVEDSYFEGVKKVAPDVRIKVVIEKSKELEEEVGSAEIIVTAKSFDFDPGKAKNLKWVHVFSAGVNTMPESILNSDVLVTNSSGVHPIPISEHVLALMLMFARQIVKTYRIQIEDKKWIRDYSRFGVFELAGKTAAVVGLGRIGRRIAKLCKALDMKVLAIVRHPNRQEENVDGLYGIEKLDDVLQKSDFVINALPGTNNTKGLFNLEKFKLMGDKSYFINIGRGFTAKEEDLIKALEDGIIAGAGLDVFEEEPLSESSPLWSMKNVIITPHYSGWTPKYMERVFGIFALNLQAYLRGEKMPNLVDKKTGY